MAGTGSSLKVILFCCLFMVMYRVYGQNELMEKRISLPRQHTNLYQALNLISARSGCFFIYDSRTLDNEKKVKLEAKNLPMRDILNMVTGDPTLEYLVNGKYILITRKNTEENLQESIKVKQVSTDTVHYLQIKGHISDQQGMLPIPFASVGTEDGHIGTVTNNDGWFALRVPISLLNSSVLVSHIGYVGKSVPIKLLKDQQVDIYLDRRIISIQEVIIRYIDPALIVQKAMDARKENYSSAPVMMTTFYREGVRRDDKLISFSDAVFKIYKSGYQYDETFDQVKLLKSRKFSQADPADTVMLKLKAGILAGLQLDIVKCIPEFLDETIFSSYQFTYSDMVSGPGDEAFAITFAPTKGNTEARFRGTLYIDRNSLALLGARFEVNPASLKRVAKDFIQKKSRKLLVNFESVSYTVSYRKVNDKYYLDHARSDLKIRTRLPNHLKSNVFSTFMEIANCHTDTLGVIKFSRQEQIRPDVIFSDIPYNFDVSFWNDFNVIAPEESLVNALSSMIGKIEEAANESEQN